MFAFHGRLRWGACSVTELRLLSSTESVALQFEFQTLKSQKTVGIKLSTTTVEFTNRDSWSLMNLSFKHDIHHDLRRSLF